jgi:hypothetical protein
MNLLFENWRSFLKEVDIALPPEADAAYSSFAQQNAKLVLTSDNSNRRDESAFVVLANSYYWEFEDLDDLEEMQFYDFFKIVVIDFFKQIPPLNKHKIKKIVGVGTQGLAFLMETDRIVKIFLSGYLGRSRTGKEEMSFYDKEQESFFKQEKAEHSLYVISKGSVRTNIQSTKFKLNFTQMNYVEMIKLVPFEDYLEYGQRDVHLINDTLDFSVRGIKDSGERFNYEIYIEECESLGHKLNYTETLTPGEFEAFKKMVLNTLNKYGERHIKDLHAGNFAILPNTLGDSEPTFVLFDP